MTLFTKVRVVVAAAGVLAAASAVEAQQPVGAPPPLAAHGPAAGEAAVKAAPEAEAEGKVELPEADEIVTDRPDFTESSSVMPRGAFQFESGLTYEGDTVDGVRGRSLTAPGSLMRVGLGGRTELRISTEGFQSTIAGGFRSSGYSDVAIGVKIRLLDQAKAGIDFAIIPMTTLPTGADGFTSGHADPTLKLTWARELGAGWGVNGNVNFASVSDEEGRFAQRAISASFGHALAGGWEGFAELYSFTPMERGAASGVTLDWGVARQIGHDFHFDVAAGRGLTAAAPDWFIGIGFAVRGRMSSWR